MRKYPKKRRERPVLTPLATQEREMAVACEPGETRIAFLEEGRLAEYYYERGQEASIVGNIYKGRVVSVLPGLQAAFVDVGLERSGFLHARDILTDTLTIEDFMKAQQARKHEPEEDGSDEETPERPEAAAARPARGGYRLIQDLLKKGQEILVQVEKESISTKGPRLTGQVALPARLVVLIPHALHSGVSHRIADDKERDRLKKILDKATPKGFGVIARTSAEGASEAELKAEINYLRKLWKNLLAQEKKVRAPQALHSEQGLVYRVARDILTPDDRRIIIEATPEGKRFQDWLTTALESGSLKPKIELFKGNAPLFESLNLENEIDKALRPKVWLKCGGYLVIEETEALVVVDVNTGRNVGKSRQDETILKTNLEAAREIARQLRLRDLGGIIVLDFIDMRIEEHKERVFLELAQALQRDRAKTSLRQLTDLGLIEMTRKRVRGSLLRSLCDPCPMCQGRGRMRSPETMLLRLGRMLQKARRLTGDRHFLLEVSPYLLVAEEASAWQAHARSLSMKLQVEAKADLKPEDLRLVSPSTGVVIIGPVAE